MQPRFKRREYKLRRVTTRKMSSARLVFLAMTTFICCCIVFYNIKYLTSDKNEIESLRNKYEGPKQKQHRSVIGPCAINLFGLPRKFKDIVLPGMIENVIRPNAKYHCDYFVHYYEKTNEIYDRGADVGRAGVLDTEEIKLLEEKVMEEYQFTIHLYKTSNVVAPIVKFVKETEDEFLSKYTSLLHRIQTERDAKGELLLVPWKHNFPNTTIENVIKAWHSQQSVWNLMENSYNNNNGNKGVDNNKIVSSRRRRYSRVAMLRSDVLYVTPIDIYSLSDGSIDYKNIYAIIPSFDNYPVNDRLIYGPTDAVQIWATGKFDRLYQYVTYFAEAGAGIHPERFLKNSILPAIQDAGIDIQRYPKESMCFLRVRSDSSIRATDCSIRCATEQNRKAVMNLIHRPCILSEMKNGVASFECHDGIETSSLFQLAEDSSSYGDNSPMIWNGACTKSSSSWLRKLVN